MTTNITDLAFDDASDIHVVLNDDHELVATQLDFQEHGVMFEHTELPATRLFIPWSFVKTIKQIL